MVYLLFESRGPNHYAFQVKAGFGVGNHQKGWEGTSESGAMPLERESRSSENSETSSVEICALATFRLSLTPE